ncbi:fatty acid desaturase [Kordia sp. YSTF-M3]|uniref:Fatty acid desaturase n=1 Tax=Kordia aestuariivivens TaxID=2759037 RepID=A0ABR7Q4G9_9FLAO|nr:fatty acid desaturase [Kordia aestuariivivens]MBC8753447.1 fatty acid desaturase [Kordia aestuariivivens]
MTHQNVDQEIKEALKNWKSIIAKYKKKSTGKAIGQIASSFLPFIAVWALMYFTLDFSLILTFLLGIVNAFFLVRIFIIQHDCGHNSFIKSQKASNFIGYVCSIFSFLPFKYWAETHTFHHGHNGQLEKEVRQVGDLPTLTVEEFRAKSRWGRFKYKVFRSPIVIFVIAPAYYLIITTKYPFLKFNNWKRTTYLLIKDNIVMIVPYLILGYFIGWADFFAVQFIILFFFGIIAFWFFYIQHQHEHSYKKWKEDWDFLLSAIKGSSYIKLPKIMEWFTGHIGIHHIHHLNSRIPNYNLKKCFTENKILSKYVTTLSFKDGLKMMFHKLWDEEEQRMITFREYYRLEKVRFSN